MLEWCNANKDAFPWWSSWWLSNFHTRSLKLPFRCLERLIGATRLPGNLDIHQTIYKGSNQRRFSVKFGTLSQPALPSPNAGISKKEKKLFCILDYFKHIIFSWKKVGIGSLGIRSLKVVSEFWFRHPKCHFWYPEMAKMTPVPSL